ncbi:hypothetical protein ACWD4P_10620 [Kitasatospora sp. NPDC002543]
MSTEIAELVTQAGPYVTAALSAYGGSVLTRAEGAAVDATANFGRRILQSIWRRSSATGQAAFEVALEDAANDSEESDAVAALRHQIKRALREDETLRAEIASLLADPMRPIFSSASVEQNAVARDHGVIFQQGSGTQIYGSK